MWVDFFELHGFAIYHPSRWGKGVLTGVVVKGYVVIPEEDVVNGEWVPVGPFDAFADFENCDFATVLISKVLGKVELDAVWKGAFIAHEVFVEGFVGSRGLYDVAGEGASECTAVGTNFFKGNNDEGIFGQSLRDGWEFALFDLFGEPGGFVKGAVLEYGGVDFEGGTGLRCLFLSAGCGLGGRVMARVGSEASEEEEK